MILHGSVAHCPAPVTQVWDPNELADTSRDSLNHKHKLTPYQDMKLNGKVVATFVDGQQVSSGPLLFLLMKLACQTIYAQCPLLACLML